MMTKTIHNERVDCDARSAFAIISFCVFTITLASVLFIGSGAAHVVRAELPNGWAVRGLPVR